MGYYDDKRDNKRIEKQRRNNKKFSEDSKEKLQGKMEKRLEVTMISALDTFEKSFGWLWGHGKRRNQLSDDEQQSREVWDDARKQILDVGNNNIRSVGYDLSRYNVEWEGYKMHFIIKKERGNV